MQIIKIAKSKIGTHEDASKINNFAKTLDRFKLFGLVVASYSKTDNHKDWYYQIYFLTEERNL